MANLGERLKKEREIRGVSLDDIAAATRIQRKFLQALEEGNYEVLPAPVFVTGFLRAYADHLGLDADGIVAEFDALKQSAMPPVSAKENARGGNELFKQEELDKNLPYIAGGVGAFLLVLLLAIFVFRSAPATPPKVEVKPVEEDLLAQQAPTPEPLPEMPPAAVEPEPEPVAEVKPGIKTKPDEKPQAEAKPVAAKPADKPQVEAKPETKPTAAENVRAAERTSSGEASATQKYNLSMSATTEDVWVYVLVDGVTVRDMYIRAGQTVFIRGSENFNLTTGNAYFLRLKVNNTPVEIPQQGSNKVIRNWPIPLPE